jgi:hypothetical protein
MLRRPHAPHTCTHLVAARGSYMHPPRRSGLTSYSTHLVVVPQRQKAQIDQRCARCARASYMHPPRFDVASQHRASLARHSPDGGALKSSQLAGKHQFGRPAHASIGGVQCCSEHAMHSAPCGLPLSTHCPQRPATSGRASAVSGQRPAASGRSKQYHVRRGSSQVKPRHTWRKHEL